jgi:hypothetical protein
MDVDEFDNINDSLYDPEFESLLNGNPMLNFDEESLHVFDTFDNGNFDPNSLYDDVNLNGNLPFQCINRQF